MSSIPRLAKRVLLVGWDAADWHVISPLVDSGKMPALNQLIERGVMGNIATLQPCLSPLLWTSIATGKLADKHGILGFLEPDGEGGIRPSASTTRRTKALWNIVSQNGMSASVIGWYASHPAEPIRGVCVSNLFDQNPGLPDQPWVLPQGSVHPVKWHDPVADFRVHPAEIGASDLRFLIPRIDEIDLKIDHRPLELSRAVAHCASVHSVATAVMENESWDFMAIYYDLIDVAGHHFMPYHPPRMDHVPEGEFELYRDVIERVYQFHDQMLGRLLELTGPETTVIILSDHGFQSGDRRPRSIHRGSGPEAMAAAWHRQFGFLCIAGEHIRQDERVYGATLLDVAPTILMLLGIPPGKDMDGRALTQILDKPIAIETTPSWDDQPGEAGMHPPDLRIDPVSAQATIDHLVSLGYLEAPADSANGPRTVMDEAELNLALVFMNSMRPARAVPLLERLVQSHPENPRYAMSLASAYGYLGRARDGRTILESLEKRGFQGPDLDTMLAAALFDTGELDAALARLSKAEAAAPESPIIDATRAKIHIARREWKEAEAAYRRMLAIDPESPMAHDGLAAVLLEIKDFDNAASHALDALQIAYHFPMAHFHLGMAFEGMGETSRAIRAMEYAVSIVPGFVDAHRQLARLYESVGDPVQALKHRSAAAGHELPQAEP